METIILADDHPVTLKGISDYLTSLGYHVVGQYTSGIQALNNILAFAPDFAIIDISMPGMAGLEVLEKVRARNKKLKIILYTMYNDTALFEKAKELEVSGYVLKEFALEELKDCLQYLRYKKQWFSPHLSKSLALPERSTDEQQYHALSASEQKIVSLIAKRLSSREIADQLFISEKTVENHRSNIIKKLGLEGNKHGLLIWAIQHHSGN